MTEREYLTAQALTRLRIEEENLRHLASCVHEADKPAVIKILKDVQLLVDKYFALAKVME